MLFVFIRLKSKACRLGGNDINSLNEVTNKYCTSTGLE